MVISIGIVLPIVDVCSFQSQVASRSSSFGDMESMASMTPMTAAWMPKEMMSEDSDVLLAVSQLAARTLFDPAPKTTEGVAAMVKVLKPKLYQLFGSQSSSALSAFLLIWDEQFQLAAMAGGPLRTSMTTTPGGRLNPGTMLWESPMRNATVLRFTKANLVNLCEL